jgi:hypothetical protein
MREAKTMNKPVKYYSFYARKTDEFLFAGTAREISEHGHFASADSAYSTVCRVLSGRNRRYDVVVEEDYDETD